MDNDKVIEKIATLETKVEGQGKEFHSRISKLEGNNELLYRLTILSEQQQSMNKHQQEQIDKMGETFNNININLTKLNISQDDLRSDVKGIVERVDSFEEDIKDELDSTRASIKDVEEIATKNGDIGKFNVISFLSNDIMKIILTAIVVAVLSYIGLK